MSGASADIKAPMKKMKDKKSRYFLLPKKSANFPPKTLPSAAPISNTLMTRPSVVGVKAIYCFSEENAPLITPVS